MIDFTDCYTRLAETPARAWLASLPDQLERQMSEGRHGDMQRWWPAFEALPDWQSQKLDLKNAVSVGDPEEISRAQRQAFQQQLMAFHPWRKGPFSLFGVDIDTEWRSDWKWDRLKDHISPLQQRLVLDVGSGNGYHLWRMLGAGARTVIGIDPKQLFLLQFLIIKKYTGPLPAFQLPLKMEDLPSNLQAFDSVFSMGVLYHRKSPIEHLYELKGALRPGGELVLETLVVPPHWGELLVPQDRYAKMRNVWFIPSPPMLERWLERVGFTKIRTVDCQTTKITEQRSTPWMTNQSLPDFLDPENSQRTLEGYPAPMRAIIIAEKPG